MYVPLCTLWIMFFALWQRGKRYLRASERQVVLQVKDFHLTMQVGRGSPPGTSGDYTQCRVLYSRQHLHVRPSKLGCRGKLSRERMDQTNYRTTPLRTRLSVRTTLKTIFIAFNLDLTLA